jgi:hypothetical protein
VPLHDDDLLGMWKFRSGGTGAVWSDGHSSSAAALRYQHMMAGRDAAIAAALDELVEAAVALTETPPPAPISTWVARIGQSGRGKSDAKEGQAFDPRLWVWS